MNPTLSKVLDAICLERDDQKWSAASVAAFELVAAYGEDGLAERLFNEIPRTVPFEIVSELFDLLSWRTNDNGTAITRTLESWLMEGLDNRKLLVALHVEVYPFLDAGEMERVLSDLGYKTPRVAARCKSLIESRNRRRT